MCLPNPGLKRTCWIATLVCSGSKHKIMLWGCWSTAERIQLLYSILHRIRGGLKAEVRVRKKHNKTSTAYCSALSIIWREGHISKVSYLVLFMFYAEENLPCLILNFSWWSQELKPMYRSVLHYTTKSIEAVYTGATEYSLFWVKASLEYDPRGTFYSIIHCQVFLCFSFPVIHQD